MRDIRRYPEDEFEHAHFFISMRMILIYFGSIAVWLSLVSIYVSGHRHDINPDVYLNDTAYGRQHYEFIEDGNGTIQIKEPDGTFRLVNENFTVFYTRRYNLFYFGAALQTYCKERGDDFSSETWSTSLFRASQLYSSVQSPMRYGVLITMTPMILNAYLIAKVFHTEQESLVSAFIGISYVLNEFFVFISYFLILAVHITMDEKRMRCFSSLIFQNFFYITTDLTYTPIFLSLVTVSTINKFLIKNIMEGSTVASFLRFIGIFIFLYSYPVLAEDLLEYAQYVWCDTYCPPKVTILQLLCIFIIFINNYYDVRNSRDFYVMSSSVADEVDIHRRPRNSIFIRR